MNLQMKVALGSPIESDGLNSLHSTGIIFGTPDSPISVLQVVSVAEGSAPMAGIVQMDTGKYLIVAESTQFTELDAVQRSITDQNANTAEGADLTAPNGDVIHFTFDWTLYTQNLAGQAGSN